MVTAEVPVGGGVPARFAPGVRVAGYRLEEQIGAGGMAVVFRATDERLGRPVALKVLAPGLAADEVFRHRFIRESRLAAAVDDPHIIPVHEAGEDDGVLFLAMRFVPGGDAGALLRRSGPLAPARMAAIISPVASALDTAHAAGLVHRDVKPGNMLIDIQPGRPDHVYLSDFGISKTALGSVGLTDTGVIIGTLGYCAPEQIQNKTVDGRADQYSLACAAFELLSGEPPFPSAQIPALIWAHINEPPPAMTARVPGLYPAVDAVFATALAKNAPDRYPTCHDFADALRAALALPPYHPGLQRAESAVEQGEPAEPEAARRTVKPPNRTATWRPDSGPGTQTWHPSPGDRSVAVAQLPESVIAKPERTPVLPDNQPSRTRRRRSVIAFAAAAVIAAAGTVTGIALSTHSQPGRPGPSAHQTNTGPAYSPGPFSVGRNPINLAISLDGRTLYVANSIANTVTPISTATGTPGTPISVGNYPRALAITPDGRTLYTANLDSDTVTPVSTAHGAPGSPIHVGNTPDALAISPDGRTLWVANFNDGTVTPIDTFYGAPGAPIHVGNTPIALAITPNGRTLYVANSVDGTVTPVRTATGTPGRPIRAGNGPYALAITPDSRTLYVADSGNIVTPVSIATGTPGTPIPVGLSPYALAITPDGRALYVANDGDATVTPISTATETPGTPIHVGNGPVDLVITGDGRILYVANRDDGTVSVVRLR